MLNVQCVHASFRIVEYTDERTVWQGTDEDGNTGIITKEPLPQKLGMNLYFNTGYKTTIQTPYGNTYAVQFCADEWKMIITENSNNVNENQIREQFDHLLEVSDLQVAVHTDTLIVLESIASKITKHSSPDKSIDIITHISFSGDTFIMLSNACIP